MGWSIKLGRVAGIKIQIHWTFAILIAWIVVAAASQGQSALQITQIVGFILSIFVCVVLHELGHALMAKRFGVGTKDITLLPIGGVARLERIPDEPRQELLIALAGPAVNAVIAAVAFALLAVFGGMPRLTELPVIDGSARFLASLAIVNVMLFLFNLLPAFPMDGGRVLRALLATRMNYLRATQTAAVVGQGMAILFAITGIYFNWFLLLIALFVYIGANQEARLAQMRALMGGVPVREAMVTRFQALPSDTPLAYVIEQLISGEQQDFPVVDSGGLRGVLTRNDVMKALFEGRREARVSDVMKANCTAVHEGDSLEDTFQTMNSSECPVLPVLRDGQVIGMVTAENVGEWIMVQTAMRANDDNIHSTAG